jgi:hypothetical protein
MTESKLDLKGVIQVKDGPGWKPNFDPKIVFQPIMDAINAIRSVDPNIYIGLSYGANAGQSKSMFDLYGFSNANPPSTGKPTVDIAKNIDMLTSEKILTFSGSGQAAVLSDIVVKNMLKDVKKFIIIPFDTVNSKPKTDDAGISIANGTDDYTSYGHRNDCLAFAEKFLALPKSIIIGWQPMVSEFTIPIGTDSTGLKKIKQGPAAKSEFKNLYFALGAGVAGPLEPTAKKYIDFLIQNWNSESQKFIDSKIASVPDPKKKPGDGTGDDKNLLGTGTEGDGTEGDDKTKLGDDKTKLGDDKTKLGDDKTKPTGVTDEQINELRYKLEVEGVKLSDTDGEKKAAYGIAQDIFNVFFGGGDSKNKTKDFLTEKVAELAKMDIFSKEPTKGLYEITKRLENPAIAKKIEEEEKKGTKDEEAEKAAAAAAAAAATSTKPLAKPTKKYVFAFDIDNTLVRNGVFALTDSRSSVFNPSTDAADHEAMLKLMKNMLGAGHYVWIVTANNSITKDTFETKYLKSDTKITTSKNYYFMNPKGVEDDLKPKEFVADNFKMFKGSIPVDDLNFASDIDFQSKGLKPYAIRAKWMQLGHKIDDTDVEMYLFDDNAGYKPACDLLKLQFINIIVTPDIARGVSDPFKSDVLQKATDNFNAISKTTTTPVTSGGGNLNVMTFNTWYEAFSPASYVRTKYCTEGDKNKCTDTIMKTIVERMKNGGKQVIFLQEFTSRFDQFFKKVEATVESNIFESMTKVQKTEKDGTVVVTDIPQLRHFTIKVDGKKFYVYTATIATATITTIYSSELCDKSADAFFIGNTATVRNAPNHDNSPYFWNEKKDTAEETSWIFGGARPYIVLEFKDMNLVLINLHSQHDEPFKQPKGKSFAADKQTFIDKFKNKKGESNSVQTYAFTVLGNMLRDKSRIPDLNNYNIVIGGDFNAEPDRTLALLNLSLGTTAKPFIDDGIKRIDLKTCCTTDDGNKFDKAGDQIYSRGLDIVKDTYKVHEATTLTLGTGKTTQNFFSDHLPVYATITLPPVAPVAPASS